MKVLYLFVPQHDTKVLYLFVPQHDTNVLYLFVPQHDTKVLYLFEIVVKKAPAITRSANRQTDVLSRVRIPFH